MSLQGKTAIVTGGGRDIGRACVMRLAEAGARVAINYHSSSEGADSAVAEIKAAGGDAFALQGDMTSPADVAKLVHETRSKFGDSIAVLVHVTGGLIARKRIEEMDEDHWNRVMALNTSKGAVMTMSRGMAKEFGPRIRVNAVCPGMIDTDFHNTFTKSEVRKNVANATPLKREGSSEDVANLVTYLASDQAAFMSGTCVDINGGLLFS